MGRNQTYCSYRLSRNRKDNDENYALHLFDDIIRPVKNAQFLGVEIDGLLSFAKHIDTITSRASRRLNVLNVLACHWVEPKILINLYKSYVRLITEYGSSAFIVTSTTQFDRRIQNEAIRVSLRLSEYIRSELLHEYASLEQIRDRLLKMNSSLLIRMKTHNDHIKTFVKRILIAVTCKLGHPLTSYFSYKETQS